MGQASIPKRCALAVGAHPDDVELGAGALLAALADAGWDVAILVMTDGKLGGEPSERKREQREAARVLRCNFTFGDLGDGELGDGPREIKIIEGKVKEVQPELVLTHAPDDTHQDHRRLHNAVRSACRRTETLLFFESPSNNSFAPSLFFSFDQKLLQRKRDALSMHASQLANRARQDLTEWFTLRASLRGAGRSRDYAEAFMPASMNLNSALGLVEGAASNEETSRGDGDFGDLLFGNAGVVKDRDSRRDLTHVVARATDSYEAGLAVASGSTLSEFQARGGEAEHQRRLREVEEEAKRLGLLTR
jgi:LmbE family N-acetylglucosaminyl deacetylase